MTFGTAIYNEFRKRRLDRLLKEYGQDFFKGKKVLELGAGEGDLGNSVHNLGAEVMCVEGRMGNIEAGKRKYPHLKFVHKALDEFYKPDEKYDVIIHFGLLYHMKFEKLERHFKNLRKKCDFLFLETIVALDEDFSKRDPSGRDQALDGPVDIFTTESIEKALKKSKFSFVRCFDSELNHSTRTYDFDLGQPIPENAELRRMWVCEKC